MKRRILVIIILLALFVSPVYSSVAQDVDWAYRKGVGQTLYISQTNGVNSVDGTIYGDRWRGQQIYVASGKEVTRIDAYMRKYGDPPNDLIFEIQTDIEGDPSGTVIGNGSISTMTNTLTWYAITLTTPAPIFEAGEYHIVLYTSGGDSSNYYRQHYSSGDAYGGPTRDRESSFDAGDTWVDDSLDMAFKLYTKTIVDYDGSTMSGCQEFGIVNRYDFSYSFPSLSYNRTLNVTYPKTEGFLNVSHSGGVLTSEEYADIDWSSTHRKIALPQSTIDTYGFEYQLFTQDYPYLYNIYGLYYENGTFAGAVNVTAYTPAETVTEEVDEHYLFNFTAARPIKFTWPLSGGGSRQIYITENAENHTVFTPEDDYAAYGFTIRDYTGAIGSGDTYLEALRVVNGVENVIERVLIFDTVNTVPLTLTQNRIYILQVRMPEDNVYRFGYFVPVTDATPILTLRAILFSQKAQLTGKYVTVEATRPTDTHIRVNYDDTLEQTQTVTVEACYRNGTQAWTDYSTDDTVQFNWESADNMTDYVVTVEIEHEFFGDLKYTQALSGLKGSYSTAPNFGLFGDWGSVSGSSIFSIILILVVAGTFSRVSGPVGMFATILTAGGFTYLEWIYIDPKIIAAALALNALYAYAEAR